MSATTDPKLLALAQELKALPLADKCRMVARFLDRGEEGLAASVGRLVVFELQRLEAKSSLLARPAVSETASAPNPIQAAREAAFLAHRRRTSR